MPSIAIIVGSVRPRRRSLKIAQWIADIGRKALADPIEVVDLRDWPLPMDAEPEVPAQGRYSTQQTLAWSHKVSAFDAFVFVTPQYNWGYPAPLKNALDHLYREWSGKPAIIATYGGHGGDKCAAQLRQVLEGMRMRPVATMPGFELTREQIEANDGEVDPAEQFGARAALLLQAFDELSNELASAR